MALSDIIQVSITTESAKVQRAGFGVPLILAADAPAGFTERVRFYTDLAGMVTDGFTVVSGAYLQVSAVFAQNPRPPRVAVGRLALKPTQRWAVTPTAANSTVYAMRIAGSIAGVYTENLVSVTSDSSATVTEIIGLLKTAIDLLGYAVTVSDQTTFMRIVANTAGAFFSIEPLNISLLNVEQDHADPGLATDLAAIALEDSTWYALLFQFNSKACVDALSDYAEANTKLAIVQTQESDAVLLSNGADTGGAQTVAGLLKADNKFRTALIYHPSTDEFLDARWAGRCLPLDPGSETWKFKTLAGGSSVSLTATQRTNALAKYMNIYEEIAAVDITEDGKVSGNEFIDVIRFRDWLQATIGEDVFSALANAVKIPFTDAGVSVITGIVRARLQAGVDVGGLSADPAPTVTAPAVSTISTVDKAARHLPDIKFDAVLAGAIHSIEISGVVSV